MSLSSKPKTGTSNFLQPIVPNHPFSPKTSFVVGTVPRAVTEAELAPLRESATQRLLVSLLRPAEHAYYKNLVALGSPDPARSA